MRIAVQKLVALVLACIALGAAHAEWSNEELEARNLPKAQWNAIARGDFAQCQADAAAVKKQAVPEQHGCPETLAPYLYQQCISASNSLRADGEQLKQDILMGCMARKGWAWSDN